MSDWTASVASLVLTAGPLAKGVLVILLVFSVISWSVVFDRWRYFRQAARHVQRFRSLFSSGGLVNLNSMLAELKDGPLSQMAQAGVEEYELSFRRRANPRPALEPAQAPADEAKRRALLENVERALVTGIEEERALA